MMGHMKLNPRVTPAVIELVKRFEGLRRQAARLPGGGWTIGYGHVRFAREGAEVGPADAEALLVYDLSEVANALETMILAPVNPPQFEALTAFAFNIGLENFRHSTVLKWVNEGAYLQAAGAIELWCRAEFDGEDLVVDALVRRRAAEKAHFLTPPEGFVPTPSSVLHPAFDHAVVAEAQAWVHSDDRAVVVQAPLEGPVASLSIAYPPGRHGEPAPLAEIAGSEAAVGVRPPAPPPAPTVAPVLDPAEQAAVEAPQEQKAEITDPQMPEAEVAQPSTEVANDLDTEPTTVAEAAPPASVPSFAAIEPEPGPQLQPAPDAEPAPVLTMQPEPEPELEPAPEMAAPPVEPPLAEGHPEPSEASPEPQSAEVLAWVRPNPPPGRWTPPPRPDRPMVVPPVAEPVAQTSPLDPTGIEVTVEVHPTVEPEVTASPAFFVPSTASAPDHEAPVSLHEDAGAPGVAQISEVPDLFETEPAQPETSGEAPAPQGFDLRREPKAIIRSELAYILLGLLGVMLFAGALVSMMRHASAVNLLAGLIGVFFMAPSAGHFLLAFIGAGAKTEKA